MQIMAVYTYPPERRDEIVKKRAAEGDLIPPGMKLLGEWSSVAGGRVFRLVEVTDVAVLAAASNPWASLGTIEFYPVMETDKLIALLTRK